MTFGTVVLVVAPPLLLAILAAQTYLGLRTGRWRPIVTGSTAAVLVAAGLFVGGVVGFSLACAGAAAMAVGLVAVGRDSAAAKARRRRTQMEDAAYARWMTQIQQRGTRRWN